jgi:hypothetical protein
MNKRFTRFFLCLNCDLYDLRDFNQKSKIKNQKSKIENRKANPAKPKAQEKTSSLTYWFTRKKD